MMQIIGFYLQQLPRKLLKYLKKISICCLYEMFSPIGFLNSVACISRDINVSLEIHILRFKWRFFWLLTDQSVHDGRFMTVNTRCFQNKEEILCRFSLCFPLSQSLP